jgi:uncharacterized repeat protein (TIGR01451 family)
VKIQVQVLNDASPPVPTPLVMTPVVPGTPKLEFNKLASMATSVPGEPVTYRLVVRNTGTGNALDVQVRDTIPPFTLYVPGSTRVNDQPVPDHLGTSPLEAGIWLGDLPASGAPVTVSMQVIVSDHAPIGLTVRNTAHATDRGTPDQPSNTVTTTIVNTPPSDPTMPPVPNVITTVPTGGRGIITGTPTEVIVCPEDCEPTTANIHVSADSSRGISHSWLQVVGLSASGGATIERTLGPTIPERMSRAGFLAPGVDTLYFATFPTPGSQVDVTVSLTPKALQLVALDQIMRRIAAQAGIAAPTPLQVLAMYNQVPSIPSLKTALESFGPVPAPPPTPMASDTFFALRPSSAEQMETLAFEFQNATQSLVRLLYYPSEMDALRNALTSVMGQPISNAHIRWVALTFDDPSPEMDQLLNELSLVLSTRDMPAKLSFVGQRVR